MFFNGSVDVIMSSSRNDMDANVTVVAKNKHHCSCVVLGPHTRVPLILLNCFINPRLERIASGKNLR